MQLFRVLSCIFRMCNLTRAFRTW
uniref:Uncharacterized protein n=1 Tax=Arundo donax TaxID=35708 RepID=A0A0A9AQZ7_ARUDO